jgi:hypothetical protein
MQPITKTDVYFDYQIGRIVEQQMKTNQLLEQILDRLPKKEVEQVERNTNDKPNKRKRG